MLTGSIVATASSYSAASARKIKKERKEKLSIYLAKNSKNADSDLLKLENTNSPIELDVSGLEGARLYIKKRTSKALATMDSTVHI